MISLNYQDSIAFKFKDWLTKFLHIECKVKTVARWKQTCYARSRKQDDKSD